MVVLPPSEGGPHLLAHPRAGEAVARANGPDAANAADDGEALGAGGGGEEFDDVAGFEIDSLHRNNSLL